jgi:2-polyprenyl-6-hydroxyphenyl methylase/3-demethylubiquinone-9 3-methyltransferase
MTLTDRNTHFEFGQNWRDYSKTVDQAKINAAVDGLRKLFPDGLSGKTFLDIGCGSGLHSLAAMLLGAASVVAADIDENSVSTTRELLSKYGPAANWRADIVSLFDATPETLGTFDVVYSWGVLHHTGDMWRAIERAATFAKPGGQFAIAIYAKTPMDAFWKAEKKFYKSAPKPVQWVLRQSFVGSLILAKLARGQNPAEIFRTAPKRGMNRSHDLHDWMGGYPYETASTKELRERICALGFSEERSFPLPPCLGVFGSGNHELVFRRTSNMAVSVQSRHAPDAPARKHN